MDEYKKMYLKMMNSTEIAIQALIKAQQECEELYLQMMDDEDET